MLAHHDVGTVVDVYAWFIAGLACGAWIWFAFEAWRCCRLAAARFQARKDGVR